MGHKELVDLVTRKDQTDIKFYKPLWSTLVRAVSACENNISIIRLLLGEEEENGSGEEIQLFPSWHGYCDVTLKLLLERKDIFDATSVTDQDALSMAASYGHNSMINLVLENGADINGADRCRRTPLMWAARSGHVNAVKLLLEKGADANLRSGNNETALSFAREGLSPWKLFYYKLLFPEVNGSKYFRQEKLTCWQDKKGKANVAKLLLKQGVK